MTEQLSHRKNATSSTRCAAKSRRASGFTLIEVLVALAIFTVLLVIVFVPLTQATRYLAIGRTRASLQQSANGTMAQMQRDLSRAIYVYPNDNLPGVTDVAPYAVAGASAPPYYDSSSVRVGNTSRLDLLLPDLNSDGSVKYPITPAKYIVTYYARRLNDFDNALDYPTAKNPPGVPVGNPEFSPYDNPVVLYRAQYPYRDANNASLNDPDYTPQPVGYPDPTRPNVSSDRYTELGLEWITANTNNEFNLESFCVDSNEGGLVSGSHTLVTPRNVQLVASGATWPTPSPLPPNYSLKPNTTFNCADTNGDGKIDRVAINLTLMNFNISNRSDRGNDSKAAISGNPNFQRFTLSQTVNLPNIR